MYTRKCVRCGKPAVIWGGHVIMGTKRKQVIAGWCGQRYAEVGGFCGHFMPWMRTIPNLKAISR